MIHKTTTVLSVALIALLLAGCYTVNYVIPPEQNRDAYEIVGSFEVKKRASWVVFGLVPVSDAQVEEIIRDQIERKGGDVAINVVIEAQYDPVDVVIAMLVGGLFNTRSYTVKGDVARLKKGSMMGSAAHTETPNPSTSSHPLIVGDVQYRLKLTP